MIDPMLFGLFETPKWLGRIAIGALVLVLISTIVGAVALLLYAIGVNLIFIVPALAVCYLVGWFLEVFE